jgi:hypothetical protein
MNANGMDSYSLASRRELGWIRKSRWEERSKIKIGCTARLRCYGRNSTQGQARQGYSL